MGIFKYLFKSLFVDEEKLTPEYLAELRRKTSPHNYENILKKRIVMYEAEIMELQERNISVSEVLTNNLQLLKNALSEIKQ